MNENTSIAAMQERYGLRHRWLLMLSVMVGSMASVMSSTIINVAIPGMSLHFALGQARAQWVSSSFMIAMTVSMLTTPWLLMHYGYRRVYVGTLLMLMIGGIVGGLAGNYSLVIVARVAEGIAAGIVLPIPAIIILRAFKLHEQGRASSIFGVGVVLAPAIGPSIGGVLIDLFGWRSIFFMVVPFCLVSLWLAYRYVPTSAPGGGEAKSDGTSLDWGGIILTGIGTMCLLNGLVELKGGADLRAVLLLAGAVLTLIAFVVWQGRLKRMAREPLMDLDLFACRPFVMGCIVSFIYGTAIYGSTYLLPVFMQLGLNLSASYVGTIMLPAGIMLAISIATVGRISDRFQSRILVGIGLILLACSFALMVLVNLSTGLWVLVALTILGRIGLGFIITSLNLGAMRALHMNLVAQGASAINFVRSLGGAIGVSVCGIVLEWRLDVHGDSFSNPVSGPARLAAFNESFVMLASLCVLAILAASQLRDTPAPKPAA